MDRIPALRTLRIPTRSNKTKIFTMSLSTCFLANEKLMKKDHCISALFYLLLTFFFCGSVFFNIHYWGQFDWDDIFYCAVERETILTYRQIPLWNPYVGGGNVMLGYPYSSCFSPFFIPILFFGVLPGIKVNIFIFLFLGMVGMYFLGRELNLSGLSCLVPAIVFMCSSWLPLKMLLGHVFTMNIAWVPWIFLFYLKSLKNFRSIVFAAIFFCFLILG